VLRVAIVGCGKIADSHAAQIGRIPNCEIVAVCDREELMARQLQERFPIGTCFSDVAEMLRVSRPDVVHITTPPQSHYAIARQCLAHGSHVYVEKPFTINTAQAEELLAFAEARGLKVTAGHDDQFSHVARRMRDLVASGYLGGAPLHLESHYGYELTGSYARAFIGDDKHWLRQLPGGLLQNVISHGIARVAEFFTSGSPRVIAHGFVSPALRKLGETEIIDELRVILSDGDQTTAYFTFSSQMRPMLHQFRLYGAKNGLLLDEDQQTLIRLDGNRLKSYAEKFVPPLRFACQYVENVRTNLRTFLARDFHMKSGMKFLIESFYRSVSEGGPLPVRHKEILMVSRIMDEIFDQVAKPFGNGIIRETEEVSLQGQQATNCR
jgi:predicted dehydrogenase